MSQCRPSAHHLPSHRVLSCATAYHMRMTKDAEQLLAAALKEVKLSGSFSPAELGAKLGLDKFKSEAAARWLSNAGVLELGFDSAARFTRDFRMAHRPAERKTVVTNKPR